MEINVIESKATRLVFELLGSDHTFCNVLKEELKENENVTISTYNISHPLHGKPRFIIETKGEKPTEALQKAVKSLKKKNSDFQKAFDSMK